MKGKKLMRTIVYVKEETLRNCGLCKGRNSEELLYMKRKKPVGTVVYVMEKTLRNCCLY